MSYSHVENFAYLVGKDPSLFAKLGLDKVDAAYAAAAASAAAVITNAVKEAKALGLEFTEEEALIFIAGDGEMRERHSFRKWLYTQVEAVAGGANAALVYQCMEGRIREL